MLTLCILSGSNLPFCLDLLQFLFFQHGSDWKAQIPVYILMNPNWHLSASLPFCRLLKSNTAVFPCCYPLPSQAIFGYKPFGNASFEMEMLLLRSFPAIFQGSIGNFRPIAIANHRTKSVRCWMSPQGFLWVQRFLLPNLDAEHWSLKCLIQNSTDNEH